MELNGDAHAAPLNWDLPFSKLPENSQIFSLGKYAVGKAKQIQLNQLGPAFLKTTRKFTKEKFSVRTKYAPWGKAKEMQLAQLGPGFLREILLANSSCSNNLSTFFRSL